MRKKILAVVLSLALSLTVFACGDSDSGTSADVSSDVSVSESGSAESENTDAEVSDETDSDITFEGQTVMDNDEMSIEITGIETSSLWGTFTLDFELENKSDSATYTASSIYVAVNGLMNSDAYLVTEVTAGNKALDSMEIYTSTLSDYGIDQITDILMAISVYDSDTWETVAEETVHVYPYGEENASVYERASQDSDEVVIDDDSMTLTIIGYEPEGDYGYTVNAYVVNKTDASVMFSLEDASVNGYMCDPYWAADALIGTGMYAEFAWDDSYLEEIGITDPGNEIESIEFTFVVYDSGTYETYSSQTVTLNP